MTHIREKLAWSLVAALGLLVLASFAGVVRGGPLDPTSGPASTPNGIDGRIPISALPFTISVPGSYVATCDLERSNGVGIIVNANDVTIDLNGFTLDGVNKGASGIVANEKNNLSVVNGIVRGWNIGIDNVPLDPNDTGGVFQELQLVLNNYGVRLAHGARLQHSSVVQNTITGVVGGDGATISDSNFLGNTKSIAAGARMLIEDNHIDIPAGGTGIEAANLMTVRRNYISNVDGTAGYTTIALGVAAYVVVIENRMKFALTSGNGAMPPAAPVIIYDATHPLTNISP